MNTFIHPIWHGLGMISFCLSLGMTAAASDTDGDGVADEVEIVDGTHLNNNASFAAYSIGLEARYALDGNALDSSGKNANGTLGGNPSTVTGVVGQAIEFDGVDDSFTRYTTPNSLPFTWAMWVKAPASAMGTSVSVIQVGDPARMSPGLQFNPINPTQFTLSLYQYPYAGANRESAIQNCSSTTSWHHLAYTANSNGERCFYFDGAPIYTYSEINYGEVNRSLYMGGNIGLNGHSQYTADEVRVYARALSAQELAAMVEAQKFRPPSITNDLSALYEALTGNPVALSVTASGNPDVFSYQWYFNNSPIDLESGGQNATLNVVTDNTTAGNYHVRVTNSEGSVDSSNCLVAPADDDDGDQLSNWREIHIFLTNAADADSDDDGLDDGSEINTHSTDPNEPDSDHDGYLDGYEVANDGNPMDSNATPAATPSIFTAIELRFPAAIGHNYRVESSVDLNAWETIETDIPGNGSEIQRFYSIQGTQRGFLRVCEETTPE